MTRLASRTATPVTAKPTNSTTSAHRWAHDLNVLSMAQPPQRMMRCNSASRAARSKGLGT